MTQLRRNSAWLPEMFNDLFVTDFMPKANATAPAINVKESDKGYIVELAAPGMTKEDFCVHINDEGNLIVKMENKHEVKEENKTMRYLRREFSYSSFRQSFSLPETIERERISAKMENGVLKIEIPKKSQTAAEAKAKCIEIE